MESTAEKRRWALATVVLMGAGVLVSGACVVSRAGLRVRETPALAADPAVGAFDGLVWADELAQRKALLHAARELERRGELDEATKLRAWHNAISDSVNPL